MRAGVVERSFWMPKFMASTARHWIASYPRSSYRSTYTLQFPARDAMRLKQIRGLNFQYRSFIWNVGPLRINVSSLTLFRNLSQEKAIQGIYSCCMRCYARRNDTVVYGTLALLMAIIRACGRASVTIAAASLNALSRIGWRSGYHVGSATRGRGCT